MGRPAREPPALNEVDGKAAVMRILRHSLRCVDVDCADCAHWRDVLDGGSPALLLAGSVIVAKADRGEAVERFAVAVVAAVTVARTRPSASLGLDDVEAALRALAAAVGEELPPPRRKR